METLTKEARPSREDNGASQSSGTLARTERATLLTPDPRCRFKTARDHCGNYHSEKRHRLVRLYCSKLHTAGSESCREALGPTPPRGFLHAIRPSSRAVGDGTELHALLLD
jgi:hypothetical protein